MVSPLPPFLFFNSALSSIYEKICSILKLLRRWFIHISLRKINLLSLIYVGKTLKNFYSFMAVCSFKSSLVHTVSYSTLYGYQVNFVFEFNVYLFVLFLHIFCTKSQESQGRRRVISNARHLVSWVYI